MSGFTATSFGLILSVLSAVGAVGCIAGDEVPFSEEVFGDNESAISGRQAYLSVVSRNALGRPEAPIAISAQFVDFRGVTLATVRQSLDLWVPPADPIIDHCVLTHQQPEMPIEEWPRSQIYLMNAGPLQVNTVEGPLTLEPRRLPDLFPFLRGFTYGMTNEERPRYLAGGEVQLTCLGADQVDAFDLVLSMPAPIAIQDLNGIPVGSSEMLDLSDDEGLLVMWTPSHESEVVTLVLQADSGASSPSLTCTAVDDGAFMVDYDALESLHQLSQVTSYRLTLRRADAMELDLPGFDSAEAVAITEHSLIVY